MKAIETFGKQEAYIQPPWLVNENETIDLTMWDVTFPKERVGKESRQNLDHLWWTKTENTIEYTRMDH
jgi:hypothetical protein